MYYDYFGSFNDEGTITKLEVFEVYNKDDIGKTRFDVKGFEYLGNNLSTGVEPDDIFTGIKKYNEIYIDENGKFSTLDPLDFTNYVKVQKIKDNRHSKNLINTFVEKYSAYPYDRTKRLSAIFPEAITELPKASDVIIDFKDAIEDKISEIKSIESDYTLMWSGGIDSTLVFYLLIDNNIDFNIAMGVNSKIEYPKLYTEICNRKFKNVKKIIDLSTGSKELNNTTIITGEIGDQLIGSDKLLVMSYVERNSPFRQILTEEEYMPYFVSIKEIFEEADSFTTAEFMWALNFTFKYDSVIKRMDKHLETLQHNGIIHFFNSDLFQQWSIQNYKKNVSFYRIREYKNFYKDLIFSFNGDKDYRDYKVKQSSLKNLLDGE